MSIRNQSRNAERAQDEADFGAPVDGFPAYADERGQVRMLSTLRSILNKNYRTWRILSKDRLLAMEGQRDNHEHGLTLLEGRKLSCSERTHVVNRAGC
jgi:hypothetical protein